jgi:hypothetical protein
MASKQRSRFPTGTLRSVQLGLLQAYCVLHLWHSQCGSTKAERGKCLAGAVLHFPSIHSFKDIYWSLLPTKKCLGANHSPSTASLREHESPGSQDKWTVYGSILNQTEINNHQYSTYISHTIIYRLGCLITSHWLSRNPTQHTDFS